MTDMTRGQIAYLQALEFIKHWRASHPVEAAEARRARRNQNPGQRQYESAWRAKNPERVLVMNRRHRAKHRAALNAKQRARNAIQKTAKIAAGIVVRPYIRKGGSK